MNDQRSRTPSNPIKAGEDQLIPIGLGRNAKVFRPILYMTTDTRWKDAAQDDW